MSRNVPFPYFTTPPLDYTPAYFSEVMRSFTVYVQQMQNPGLGRNTTTVFTNMQADNDQGLEVGTLFQIQGVVHITLANFSYLAGNSGTGQVGSVTVVTT